MDHIKILNDSNHPVTNVVLSGVGGQGVLVASDILVMAAMNAGLDSKKSEIHGMAQRGGSVVSQVRYGTKIYSPLIQNGTADIIIAFEKLEAIRYLDYLKKDGIVIYNNQQITPLSVFFSNIPYPENVEEIIKKKTNSVYSIDGVGLVERLGNPRVLNTVMLGALARHLDFDNTIWHNAMEKRVPKKTLELNIKAFEAGYNN